MFSYCYCYLLLKYFTPVIVSYLNIKKIEIDYNSKKTFKD